MKKLFKKNRATRTGRDFCNALSNTNRAKKKKKQQKERRGGGGRRQKNKTMARIARGEAPLVRGRADGGAVETRAA